MQICAFLNIFTLLNCFMMGVIFSEEVRNKWNAKLFNTINDPYYIENEDGGGVSYPEIVYFNLSTILSATDNFSLANKLGQGGFGLVYKVYTTYVQISQNCNGLVKQPSSNLLK